MKLSWICLTALAVVSCGGFLINRSAAQSPSSAPTSAPAPTPRIAVCDVVEVFNNYIRTDDMSAEMAQRQQAIKDQNIARTDRISDLRGELDNLREGSEEYNKRIEELWRLQFEQEGWQKTQMGVLSRWHHQATEDMYEQIVAMVQKTAEQMDIDIVLFRQNQTVQTNSTEELIAQISRRTVLYNKASLDITGSVLARLNEEYRQANP